MGIGALEGLLLAVLLLGSAFTSAAETALFSLSEKDRARAGVLVGKLLEDPRGLLVTLLLANLLVTVLFFAFASGLAAGEGEYRAVVAGAGVLLAVLIFGEILPKTLALRAPLACARACALPTSALVAVLAPARAVFRVLLEISHRALGTWSRDEHGITTESLARVLENSARHRQLEDPQAGLLAEVVELGGIRVREIMTPRVDMLALDLGQDRRAAVVEEALARRLAWLPVVDGSADLVVGSVRMRDLLVQPDRPLAQLLMPAKFVPEVASALDLLRDLSASRSGEAVVVDEWGGTAGLVTLEDIFEEIVGDIGGEGELRERPVVALGGGRFRVAGSLSVRDWNEQFGHRVVPTEFETVGGLVTAVLGRIPRAGDRIRVGELINEVHEVRGRRVISVDMYVAAAGAGRSAA